MTEAILKEIDDRIESARKFLPEEYLAPLKALRVAVGLCREVTMDAHIYDGSIHIEAEEALLKIATILGVKEAK